jgi:hypothetical protein
VSAGYLGISHWAWCDRIVATSPHRCAFWRRDTKRFSAIEPGSPFFFLLKQDPGRRITVRAVIGQAEFRAFETRAVDDLWGYYGLNELGVLSVEELMTRLREIDWAGEHDVPHMVGVILLGPLESFRFPVTWDRLPGLGIRFSKNIVQGMGLGSAQVESLLDAGLYG